MAPGPSSRVLAFLLASPFPFLPLGATFPPALSWSSSPSRVDVQIPRFPLYCVRFFLCSSSPVETLFTLSLSCSASSSVERSRLGFPFCGKFRDGCRLVESPRLSRLIKLKYGVFAPRPNLDDLPPPFSRRAFAIPSVSLATSFSCSFPGTCDVPERLALLPSRRVFLFLLRVLSFRSHHRTRRVARCSSSGPPQPFSLPLPVCGLVLSDFFPRFGVFGSPSLGMPSPNLEFMRALSRRKKCTHAFPSPCVALCFVRTCTLVLTFFFPQKVSHVLEWSRRKSFFLVMDCLTDTHSVHAQTAK